MMERLFAAARRLAVPWLLALAAPAFAQTLEVTTDTELRASPALDAKVLSKLARGAQGEQTGSQGGWLKMKTRQQEGWVRLTHVRSLTAQQAAAQPANPLTGLTGMFSASSNRPTATTGTRGLTQEQLANAQPAPAEVQQLERYATTGAQAEQYARTGKVAPHKIAPYSEADK